jgi:diguanylate cyclase (GGDEF)-like protein
MRAQHVAAALRRPEDQWRMRLLSAQQHTELAQTLRRRGAAGRARELAGEAIACAASARELAWEPDEDAPEASLLDVVQAWALTCADDLDGALGPLRRARRRVEAEGSVWLRGYTGLALARLLARLAQRDADEEGGEEAIGLLVDAAGSFAASGDRRRYRQCLLELGQLSADLGRPGEALHWLEAYRADTGRAHARGRELWAEMFVRRSRLREAERQAALLRRHALEDPLTGLGNRRSAERRLGALRMGEQPLSLAVVDVDRFKTVNDSLSHTQGDAVLRRVADLLREHSRTGDEVYRWAGDEFLVILPRASEAQAVVVAERLRSAVAGADWRDLQLPEPVTVSIGVASAPGTAGADDAGPAGWRALFDAADLHLFSAKRSGRNRVRAPGAGAPPEDAAPEPDLEAGA